MTAIISDWINVDDASTITAFIDATTPTIAPIIIHQGDRIRIIIVE